MKKKLDGFIICLFIFSSFLLPYSAAAESLGNTAADIDTTVKVYDYADLLSDSEESTLSSMANEIAERQQMDIAIVTTNDAEGKSSMEYADDFYDYNGFGFGSDHSGLLMLINMEVREVWISTTGEAINLFLDSDIDTMLDNTYNGLSSADYIGASTTFLKTSDEHITIARRSLEEPAGNNTAVQTPPASPSIETRTVEHHSNEWIPFREKYTVIQILLVSLGIGFSSALVIMLCIVFAHKRSLSPAPGVQTYLGGKGLVLTRQEDTFMHTHTTRTAIPKNDDNGGGGGGGGSTHTSSSGSSHGGGGRSF